MHAGSAAEAIPFIPDGHRAMPGASGQAGASTYTVSRLGLAPLRIAPLPAIPRPPAPAPVATNPARAVAPPAAEAPAAARYHRQTFKLPVELSRRLKVYSSLTGQFLYVLATEAIEQYLDRAAGAPADEKPAAPDTGPVATGRCVAPAPPTKGGNAVRRIGTVLGRALRLPGRGRRAARAAIARLLMPRG